MTRSFHLGDLVSVATGRLVSPDGLAGVCAVCDFVTGQETMLHQIPRVLREITPILVEQLPWLGEIVVPDWVDDRESANRWLIQVAAKYGKRHDVRALPAGEYVGRDPLAELQEMMPHARITPIVVKDGQK